MQLISTVTVGAGGTSSIDFTSIPQTFTDLLVVFTTRSGESANVSGQYMRLNADYIGANYTNLELQGSGGGAPGSFSGTYAWVGYGVGNTATSNTFGNGQLYIPNYTSSANKTVLVDYVGEHNSSSAYQNLFVVKWSNTAAVTGVSLNFADTGQTTLQYSSASLYGIKQGSGGATVS